MFSAKFCPEDPRIIVSAGWDNTLQIYDMREDGPVASLYGPHVCGDSVDMHKWICMTGSYRTSEQVELWDIRNHKKLKFLEWNAHAKSESDKAFLYAAQFSKSEGGAEFILAGGAGRNEVRIFDNTEEGNHKTVGVITELEKACLAVDWGNRSDMFAVGSADGLVRVFSITKSF